MPASPDSNMADAEIVCVGEGGRRLRLFTPVLGTTCSRCGTRADDVCLMFETADGATVSRGLCGPCVIELLDGVLGPGSRG